MNRQNHAEIQLPRFEDVLHDVFEKIENRGQRGLETGFFELDDMLNGLQGGEMIVIASRPSIGKTSFATNIVEHVAVDNQVPAAVFTLEMSNEEFARRLMCSRAEVDAHKLRKGLLNSQEYVSLANTIGEIALAPLWVTSLPSVSLADLCDLGRRAVCKHGARLIVIDYLQLIDAPGTNRTEELTLISRRLKSLAMELNVPVVCLSQLNRGMFQPELPRPRMADLRGSGTLEDDADVVILLHREDYYRMSEPDFQPDNIAEVIIAKQRNGPTGTVKLTFLNRSTRFANLASQADPF